MRRFGIWEPLEIRRLLAAGDYIHHSPPADSEVVEGDQVADTSDEPTGSLTGYKFLDANGDGLRNVEATSDSLFVFALDASQSSSLPFGGSTYSRLERS